MTTEGRHEAVGVVGFGRIGRRIATRLVSDGGLPPLGAVLVRPDQRAEAAALLGPDRVVVDEAEFLAMPLAVVAECASAATLARLGPAILARGADLLPLSLAAFADRDVEASLMTAARAGPGRLEIPAGAMGSVDFLAAAREDELSEVVFRAAYPVARWRGGAAESLLDLAAATNRTTFLRTSVREAVALFPRHINVAVGVALAGLGLDRTICELIADPALDQAEFEIEAVAGPGPVTLRVGGRRAPLGADPVDYTTFSVLRLLRRRTARVLL